MAGRGFRGASARVVFSATGVNSVLASVSSIDNAMKRLSDMSDAYAANQLRIADALARRARLENQILEVQSDTAEKAALLPNALAQIDVRLRANAEKQAALNSQLTTNAKIHARIESISTRALSVQNSINKSVIASLDSQAQNVANLKASKRQLQANNKELDAARDALTAILNTGGDTRKAEARILRLTAERVKLLSTIAKRERDIARIPRESTENLRVQNKRLKALRRQYTEMAAQLTATGGRPEQIQLLKLEAERLGLLGRQVKLRSQLTNLSSKEAQKLSGINSKIQALNNQIANLEKNGAALGKGAQSGFAKLLNTLGMNSQALSTLGKAATAAAAAFALLKFVQFAAEAAGLAAQVERAEAAIRGLTGSAKVARGVVDDAFAESMRFPISPQEYLEGARTLLSVGAAAETLNAEMKNLAVVAMAANQPLSDISVIYGEILNKNRLYREDLLQFSRRGIPVAQELASMLGITRDELNELVTDGKITFDVFRQGLESLAKGKFGSLPEEILGTTAGKVQLLSNALTNLKRDFGEVVLEVSATGIDTLLQTVNSIAERFQSIIQYWREMQKESKAAQQKRIEQTAGIVGPGENPDQLTTKELEERIEAGREQMKDLADKVKLMYSTGDGTSASLDKELMASYDLAKKNLTALEQQLALRKQLESSGGSANVEMDEQGRLTRKAEEDAAARLRHELAIAPLLEKQKEEMEKVSDIYDDLKTAAADANMSAATLGMSDAESKIYELEQALAELDLKTAFSAGSEELLVLRHQLEKTKDAIHAAEDAKRKFEETGRLKNLADDIAKAADPLHDFKSLLQDVPELLEQGLISETAMIQYLAQGMSDLTDKADKFRSTVLSSSGDINKNLQSQVLSDDNNVEKISQETLDTAKGLLEFLKEGKIDKVVETLNNLYARAK